MRDDLPVSDAYHVRVDGPNGFMREFVGRSRQGLSVSVDFAKRRASSGVLEIAISNPASAGRQVTVYDESYGSPVRNVAVAAHGRSTITIDTSAAHGWYDFSVRAEDLSYRYAGRVETGKWSISDPAMSSNK